MSAAGRASDDRHVSSITVILLASLLWLTEITSYAVLMALVIPFGASGPVPTIIALSAAGICLVPFVWIERRLYGKAAWAAMLLVAVGWSGVGAWLWHAPPWAVFAAIFLQHGIPLYGLRMVRRYVREGWL